MITAIRAARAPAAPSPEHVTRLVGDHDDAHAINLTLGLGCPYRTTAAQAEHGSAVSVWSDESNEAGHDGRGLFRSNSNSQAAKQRM